MPTVGFQVEEFTKNNIRITAFDMSGQSKWRNLWEHHYGDAQAIIWVIDSTDKFRLVVVKDELTTLLESKGTCKSMEIPLTAQSTWATLIFSVSETYLTLFSNQRKTKDSYFVFRQ